MRAKRYERPQFQRETSQPLLTSLTNRPLAIIKMGRARFTRVRSRVRPKYSWEGKLQGDAAAITPVNHVFVCTRQQLCNCKTSRSYFIIPSRYSFSFPNRDYCDLGETDRRALYKFPMRFSKQPDEQRGFCSTSG